MKRTPRRKNGRVRWASPTIRAHVRAQLEQGKPLSAIAAGMGVTPAALSNANQQYLLDALPPGRVFLPEAAHQLGITNGGVHKLLQRHGITPGVWGRHRTLTDEQVAAIAAERGETTRQRPPGYATTLELARMWRVSESSVHDRIRGLPRLAWITTPRLTFLYDLRVVADVAPPVAPISCPRGYLMGKQIAAELNLDHRTVYGWARAGCPHIRGRRALYYDPHAVIAWLEVRPTRAKFATALRAALQPQAQQRAA